MQAVTGECFFLLCFSCYFTYFYSLLMSFCVVEQAIVMLMTIIVSRERVTWLCHTDCSSALPHGMVCGVLGCHTLPQAL